MANTHPTTDLHIKREPSQLPPAHTITISHVLGASLLVVGLCTGIAAVYLMVIGYSIVPYWDEMDELLRYVHAPVWHWVFEQHNEHRIVFYKLLSVLDMHINRGSNWPMYLACLCIQIIFAVLIILVLVRQLPRERRFWLGYAGIVLYCVFCPSQWENFTWAFQVSFLLVNLLVLASVVTVVLQRRAVREGHASAALACTTIAISAAATFTNGNGILVWPTIVLAALFMSLPLSLTGAYVVGGIAVGGLFLPGYTFSHQIESPTAILANLLPLVEYVEKYFGGAILFHDGMKWASQVGEAALIATLAVLIYLCRYRDKISEAQIIFGTMILYCLSTAAITSVARISLGTDQAFSSRYQSVALLFWLSVTLVILMALRSAKLTKLFLIVAGVFLCIVVISASQFKPIADDIRLKIAGRNIGGSALISRVDDPAVLRRSILPFAVDAEGIEYLRAAKLSFLSTPLAMSIGKPLSDSIDDSQPRCMGYIDQVEEVSSPLKLKLTGWIADGRSRRPPEYLVLASGNQVVGVGASGLLREDVVKATGSRRTRFSGWIGYASLNSPVAKISVYGIKTDHSRAACYLGTVSIQPRGSDSGSRVKWSKE